MNDCWIYLGPFHRTYNAYYGRYKGIGAHRISYEVHKGQIPRGLTIDHLCRNTVCINPAHLEAVTLKENILRGESFSAVNARKSRCKNGRPYDLKRKRGDRECSMCKRKGLYKWLRGSTAGATRERRRRNWAPSPRKRRNNGPNKTISIRKTHQGT